MKFTAFDFVKRLLIAYLIQVGGVSWGDALSVGLLVLSHFNAIASRQKSGWDGGIFRDALIISMPYFARGRKPTDFEYALRLAPANTTILSKYLLALHNSGWYS